MIGNWGGRKEEPDSGEREGNSDDERVSVRASFKESFKDYGRVDVSAS